MIDVGSGHRLALRPTTLPPSGDESKRHKRHEHCLFTLTRRVWIFPCVQPAGCERPPLPFPQTPNSLPIQSAPSFLEINLPPSLTMLGHTRGHFWCSAEIISHYLHMQRSWYYFLLHFCNPSCITASEFGPLSEQWASLSPQRQFAGDVKESRKESRYYSMSVGHLFLVL